MHYNSAIWNNALWSIRTRLAQIDGQAGNTSELAHAFDRAVYGALATRLTPTSGFVDARAAVEQVIIDSQLDPVVLRTAREVFDAEQDLHRLPDTRRAGRGQRLHLAADPAAPVDLRQPGALARPERGSDFSGYAASTSLGGSGAPSLSASVRRARGRLRRRRGHGARRPRPGDPHRRLRAPRRCSTASGPGGHARGRVRRLRRRRRLAQPRQHGEVRRLDRRRSSRPRCRGSRATPSPRSAPAAARSPSAPTRARSSPGTPAAGDARQVGQLPGAILSTATYGGPVFAIDDAHRSVLFTADGQTLSVTSNATPFGAAMSGEYVVWAEATGPIQTPASSRAAPRRTRRPTSTCSRSGPGRSTTCTPPPRSRGSRPSPAASWSGRTPPTAVTTCSPPPYLEGSDDRLLGPRRRWWLAPLVVVLGLVGHRLRHRHRRHRRRRVRSRHQAGDAHRLRDLGQRPPGRRGRRRGRRRLGRAGPAHHPAEGHRPAARRDRHRLGRPAGRRHRLPLRAQRRVVAGHPDGVHGRLRTGPVRRRLHRAAARRAGHRDGARHRHDEGHPGRRRRAGPRRVPRLRRARRPADRRPGPGLPGAVGADGPEAPARPGARDRRAGGRRHRPGHAVAGGDAPRRRRARLAGPGGHDRRRHHPDRRGELLHRRHHRRHPQRPAGHRRGPGRAPVGGLGGDVPAPACTCRTGRSGGPDPNSVEITGPNPIGGTLTGARRPDRQGRGADRHHHAVVGPGQREPAAS